MQVERIEREIYGLRVVTPSLSRNLFVFLPRVKGLLPVLHEFVSMVDPSAEPFTYFGDSFVGFEPPDVGFEWPAIVFEGPGTGPLIGSGEDDSVMEESSIAGTRVDKRVRAFGGFEQPTVGFEGPAIAFEGPATGPLIGSGEDDSVTEESLVTGAGEVERMRGWMAIGGSRPYSGEGEEVQTLLGNDAARAAMKVFEISSASQAICGAGVTVRERRGDVSGTISPPESAAGSYFARDRP